MFFKSPEVSRYLQILQIWPRAIPMVVCFHHSIQCGSKMAKAERSEIKIVIRLNFGNLKIDQKTAKLDLSFG